jgi:hypothetical protein
MIVKPSVSFLLKDNDATLFNRVNGIVTAMTNNASYPSPTPTLADVGTANDDFATAMANAVDGGLTLTAIKNQKRAALVALVRQLAIYVQANCTDDLAVLLSSGFPPQKPQRQPVGVLQPPSNLTVTYGPRTGELRAKANPVAGAAVYNWQLTAAANPGVVLQTGQSTAANYTFTGLTPGQVYNTVVNVVGAAGPSSWSEPVPQMAA